MTQNSDILIMDPAFAMESIRQGAYKNPAYAISELIDNSIQSNAMNIDIFVFSELRKSKSKRVEQIIEIAILDNGSGMDPDILQRCLSLGYGTRINKTKKGDLSKFGYGLKGSSLAMCKRVEVYSWLKKDQINMNYLDIDEIKDKELTYFPPIQKTDLDKKYKKVISEIPDKGTFVVWKNIDRIMLKKADALERHIQEYVCRIYRHFLDEDDELGKKRNITLNLINRDGEIQSKKSLKPFDHLFLLTPNMLPGEHANTATSLTEEEHVLKLEYQRDKFTDVKIITSLAKPEIQAAGVKKGNLGDLYGKNIGISFVREGREINLAGKGYVVGYEPRERWWGCEVQFEEKADNIFGITNNKQDVLDMNFMTPQRVVEIKEMLEDLEDIEDYNDEYYNLKARLDINHALTNLVSKVRKITQTRHKGKGGTKGQGGGSRTPDPLGDVIDEDEDTRLSDREKKEKEAKEKIEELKKHIRLDDPTLSEEEIDRQVRERLKLLVDILEESMLGDRVFIDRKTVGNACTVILNQNHPFYEKCYSKSKNMEDEYVSKSLDYLLMSFANTENTLIMEIEDGRAIFNNIRDEWGKQLKQFMQFVD